MIVIVDYGMGNIGSIANMIKKAGGQATLSADPKVIEAAEKLILPGVGAFNKGMQALRQQNLVELLNHCVLERGVPILGICLGMHLFTSKSEEGSEPGLGWIKATTVRFSFAKDSSHLKVPHMGWNTVDIKKDSPLFNSLYDDAAFYFVHSYYVDCHDKDDVVTTTSHGFDFVSSIQRNNIYATQFHPEKSHKYGLKIMKNFVDLETHVAH